MGSFSTEGGAVIEVKYDDFPAETTGLTVRESEVTELGYLLSQFVGLVSSDEYQLVILDSRMPPLSKTQRRLYSC